MNQEMNLNWQEILVDIATVAGFWQFLIIASSLVLAWLINGALRAYVMRHAPENWRLGIGGINRVLFPLSSLVFVLSGQLILQTWQHTSMLYLASRLLVAMAVVRLLVYAIRYIIAPGGLLKALENTIALFIWLILALHLSGLQSQVVAGLESIQFNIGKSPVNLLLVLQGLLTIVVTIFAALYLGRIIENKLMRVEHVDPSTRVMLTKVMRVILLFIAVLIGLSAVGLDLTLLSVFGGAFGVGLGLGLQRIASNYVCGFIILLDKSIKLGDIVTIDIHYGVVRELRTRYLVLQKLDGTEVIIPNETTVINPVINHSFSDRNTRVLMPIQVAYQSDLELVLSLMLQAARAHPRVLTTPEPTALVKGFADNGVDLTLSVWIPDAEQGTGGLQSEIFLAIWHLFKEHQIEIPYPQRDVRIMENKSS